MTSRRAACRDGMTAAKMPKLSPIMRAAKTPDNGKIYSEGIKVPIP